MKNSLFYFRFVLLFLIAFSPRTFSKPLKPKLAVIIVVDQMRYDYLTRFSGVFNYGLSKLINKGAYFTEAYHDHAFTSTAPGHATIATGCFPSKHGIVLNDYYDQTSKKIVYSCLDSTSKILDHPDLEGISPKRLLRDGIADWIKKSNPKSKVYCVSIKDRPSVMLGGKHPDGVFWYVESLGKYVSSEYYMKKLPSWVHSFNESGIIYKHLNDDWTKQFDKDYYLLSREDNFPAEFDRIGRTFPHNLRTYKNRDAKSAYNELVMFSPFGEEMNFAFAKSMVENEDIGIDDNPDLLFIGCSSADKLGHDFGPLSQEMEEYYLRLDKYIMDFMNFLDNKIGKDNYIIALSADHGVATMPEELERRGYDANRINSPEVKSEYLNAAEIVQKKFGLEKSIVFKITSIGIVLKYDEAEAKNISPAVLRKAMADQLNKIFFVGGTYTIDELKYESNKEYFQKYKNNFMPERSYDIIIRPKKYYSISHGNYGVSHGTPYDYDSHIPIIFYGAGIKAEKIDTRIVTVDIAPTIADLLGVKYDGDIDGVSRSKMILK